MREEVVGNERVTDIIKKFKNHRSIKKIKGKNQVRFSFLAVEQDNFGWEIDFLEVTKAIQEIPIKIEQTVIFFSENILQSFTARFLEFLGLN